MARGRWLVLAASVVLLVAGAGWGSGVFDRVTSGGFADPASESTVAQERIAAEIGAQDTHLIVLYTSPARPVDDPAVAGPVTATLAALRQAPEVASVVSWYDTGRAELLSTDRRATYATVRLGAPGDDEDALIAAYHRVQPRLAPPAAAGVRTQVGGLVPFLAVSNEQTERDLVRGELIAFPVLLVLLVLIFRGAVAALMPLAVGLLAILGGLLTTRLLTLVTDVSVFAINIITVLGLGLAIDYALLVVSRFRDELAAGHPPVVAVGRTLASAGRSVLVSGLITMLALASLLVFPQVFMRSMAYGGIAAIGIAMLGALTVLPALLVVLGHRIHALRVPLPWHRRVRTGEGGWARLARSVMRRPVRYLAGAAVVLALLAVPALRIEFGGFDERLLPAGTESRVAAERVATEFPAGQPNPILLLVSGADQEQAREYAAAVATLPEVTDATVTSGQGDSWLVSASYPGEPSGDVARDAVRAARALPSPAGAEVLVGGRTAVDLDLVESLRGGLPWLLLWLVGAVMVLLFLAFGSVLLPVKAVLMNVLSIGAALGVAVWGFQDGGLADLLGFTDTGFLQPAVVVLMLVILFGLSTDYEVFLLSRVREEWDRTGENTAAVAAGMQRTGRIITAAALLLVVVFAGFATGDMAFLKMLGVGMIVAIVLDATLVRALLVPATMRLLGRWNWWAPGRLARVHRRYRLERPGPPG
ncbi:MAG: MMPL family transporter [Natronosporangium sp.]